MDPRKFTGKEGQLISAEQALRITEPFQRREQEITLRGENYVKAEFFGIHTFNELMSIHGETCVGFRVYYGITEEEGHNAGEKQMLAKGTKRPTARLVLIPVDAHGNDLTKSARLSGMKDMPARKEAMTGGPLCPHQC
ncbi:hypothetical protein [Dyadobacter sp. CY347]|uniref:hypothetical protein n=1 Tax=Dyadobacter sp. CY347 TaxID=2909336 RepID=UPI001F252310|nr:hypothetical protein [Dyadobacter sp. CY347]MCF2486809.1 hypothetical protein [Dyadobacter sp. CY347]